MSLLSTSLLKITIPQHKKTAQKHDICGHVPDLSLQAGEVWGILGPNGSGKTTLLHTLAGLRTPATGKILLDEQELQQIHPKQRARLIGLLCQETITPFAQTVYEYCLASRFPHRTLFKNNQPVDHALVLHALATMEIADYAERSITELSGGEKRRLAIAALLVQAPTVYLLDEPVNHLDIRHQQRVLQYFRDLAAQQGVSIMMSVHDINHAQRFCDRLLLIDAHGQIQVGEPGQICNAETLSHLYQYPIKSVSDRDHVWFIV